MESKPGVLSGPPGAVRRTGEVPWAPPPSCLPRSWKAIRRHTQSSGHGEYVENVLTIDLIELLEIILIIWGNYPIKWPWFKWRDQKCIQTIRTCVMKSANVIYWDWTLKNRFARAGSSAGGRCLSRRLCTTHWPCPSGSWFACDCSCLPGPTPTPLSALSLNVWICLKPPSSVIPAPLLTKWYTQHRLGQCEL